ncbi:MAG: class I SAM-dependent methyltransferase [Armatimonadota bacterium]
MYASYQKWTEFYRLMERKADGLIDPATGLVSRRFAETIVCPLCGSSSFRPWAGKHGFTYVQCIDCAFVYMNPQLKQDAIDHVYNDRALREFFFKELLLPYVERDQRREFEARLQQIEMLVRTSNRRLLDIGCAAGLFLSLAEEHGFRGEGLELNELYIDYARIHRNIKVHRKPLEEMHYPESSFGVVTLWDVLEHLPKPVETVREINRVLSPGGVLAFTTINHACVNERLLRENWRYYMPPDHLCSFTPALVTQMLNRCGFIPAKVRHHYMFEVLAERYFRFLIPSSSSRSGRSLNKVKKIAYLAFRLSSEAIFRVLRSGDLLTVYAWKP